LTPRVEPSALFAFLKEKQERTLSLIPNTEGAYKCHRGCTPAQIREAIGQPKDRQIPAALASKQIPALNILTPADKVVEACDRLMNSKEPLQWLKDRGITPNMARHFRLGVGRSLCDSKHLTSICIPITADIEGQNFYVKKRVAPWIPKDEQPKGYKKWSQYGIPSMVWFTHQPEFPKQTWLVAGEWDAMMLGFAMRDQDEVAICTFTTGETNIPRDNDELKKLKGELITFYDLDDAGINGALKIQNTLRESCRIATVPAPKHPKDGFDVSDSLNAGFTVLDFLEAAKHAKPYVIPKQENPLRSHLVTTDELIARAPDYVEWLVNDILTSNELFMLAAPPRGGKSLFVMGLSKAIATGTKFLDRPTMQGPVIYVNLEDADAKIKERAESQLWQAGIDVYWLDAFKLSQLDNLIELIEEIGPRLVVLDTLTRIRSEGISESSAEIGLVLEPLQECAKRCNTCILLIHHTKKVNVDDQNMIEAAESIRGSSAIRATCRGNLVIAPGKESYRLVAENGHGKHDLAIRIDCNTLEWKLLGKWSPAINQDHKTKAIDYLNKVGSATCEQIAHETATPIKSLHVALSRLVADGLLKKVGNRKAAVYERAIQHIQQLNSVLNSPNEDGVCDKDPYSTKNTFSFKDEDFKSDRSLFENQENPQLLNRGGKTGSTPYAPTDSAVQHEFNNCENVELVEGQGDRWEAKSSLKNDPKAIVEPLKAIVEGSQAIVEKNSKTIVEGTKVIVNEGRFFGRPCVVLSVDSEGVCEVREKDWAITRKYPRHHLRLDLNFNEPT
jgi:hypothetical protein